MSDVRWNFHCHQNDPFSMSTVLQGQPQQPGCLVMGGSVTGHGVGKQFSLSCLLSSLSLRLLSLPLYPAFALGLASGSADIRPIR